MYSVYHFRRFFRRSLNHTTIIAGVVATFLSCTNTLRAQTSPCDLNADGVVNAADVTLAINMAIGLVTPCTAQVEGNNICTVITVQRVWNAYNGQACVTYNTHAATLSWTASTTSGVTSYNVYRGTSSTGPFSLIASAISALTYKDTSVVAGTTYYYVATAVASGVESAQSSPSPAAAIPIP